MPFPQRTRALEKRFRNHGEELGRIRRSVIVDHRFLFLSLGRSVTERVEFRAHHARPREIIAARLERWGAVAALVLEIELVGKFVQHQVLAVCRRSGTVTHRVPRQHERAESAAGVAESIVVAFLPDAAADVSFLACGVTRRIDKDRNEIGIVIRLAMQQEQTRLAGYGDANLVRQLQPAAALEALLGQKYLGVTKELRLIGRCEAGEDREIALEDLAPRSWPGLIAQARAAARFEEVKNHVED